MSNWTEQEKRNAMTYGVCRICREPRFMKKTVRIDNIVLTDEEVSEMFPDGPAHFPFHVVDWELARTCPNGHLD